MISRMVGLSHLDYSDKPSIHDDAFCGSLRFHASKILSVVFARSEESEIDCAQSAAPSGSRSLILATKVAIAGSSFGEEGWEFSHCAVATGSIDAHRWVSCSIACIFFAG